MPIGSEDWKEIELALTGEEATASLVAQLRKTFPRLSWTLCDASDVGETPYRSFPRFDVHLIDAVDHCVRITTAPEQATGLIVADRTTRS
jgi:hypothetical protein